MHSGLHVVLCVLRAERLLVHKFPGFAFATPAGPLPRICVCHSSGTTEQDAAADTIIRAQKALATTS
jgi:hypothetical protein